MTKYTNINGVDFETHTSKNAIYAINRLKSEWHGHDIYYYYDKPSETKISIYNEWREWYSNANNVTFFQVDSANIFKFTIVALYEDESSGEILGFIRITKDKKLLLLPE